MSQLFLGEGAPGCDAGGGEERGERGELGCGNA